MSNSAFMRGEGTFAAVRRPMAAFRAWRSCTVLFHHGCAAETRSDDSALRDNRGLLLQLLGLIVRDQRLDQRLDLAVHDLIELVDRKPDTVIGEPVLREIVGAD